MLASVVSLAGLLAAPAGAQMMPPGQVNPAYNPNMVDPEMVDPQMVDPNDPRLAEPDPEADVPPDLGPDDEIAQSYDDGYDPQAYTQFQDALAPYGTWENDDSYGEVWTPAAGVVGANFVPYGTGGHWVRSEYGWTWASDWNWGWAPFHYGRWAMRAGRWSWVPGTMWGPSWVAWRTGSGYVGWAPLPPRGVRLASWTRAGSPWCFTPASRLGSSRLQFVAPHYLPRMFAHTSVVSSDRLLTHGGYRVHINAGPVRAAYAPEMPLARVAPSALPRRTVYPHAGVPVYSRPWVRGPEAQHDPLTHGWRAGTPVSSSRGSFGQAAPYGGRPMSSGQSFARPVNAPTATFGGSRPAPSYGAPVYGRPSPNFAGHPSAGGGLSFAPHPGYQPPAARAFTQPARPAYQPQSMRAFSPAPHAFTPPPSNGGFHGYNGGASSGGGSSFRSYGGGAPAGGGFHPPAGGGFQPQGGGGFHPQAGAGGGFHPQAGGGFQPQAGGGGFHAPAGGGFHPQGGGGFQPQAGGGGAHFGGGGSHHR
ncbi:MAG: DUF6600 domain-containing protein [Polyangia bacterium]